VLDRCGCANLVENLHCGAAGIFVLILEHIDEVAAGIRVIRLDDDIHRLVLHFNFRIAQQLAHQLDVDRAIEARQGEQGRLANQLVRILELILNRA
jgi:hypothetical protein